VSAADYANANPPYVSPRAPYGFSAMTFLESIKRSGSFRDQLGQWLKRLKEESTAQKSAEAKA